MHEMALCAAVVELIEDAARAEGFASVRTVTLDLGALSHAAPEAMAFCFDAVARGTVAEGARLAIHRTPGAGWCAACAATVPLAERFAPCPRCGARDVQLTAGDELRLRDLEVA